MMNKIQNNIEQMWLLHTDGHLNEDQRDFLIETLIQLKPKYCLEIGFATGRSTTTILESCHPKFMMSIDIDLDYMNARDHANYLQSVYKNLVIIEENSNKLLTNDFLNTQFVEKIDFAFVDGNHKYNQCLCDLNNIYPHMSEHGMIIVDDYKSGPPNGFELPGVNKAVDKFCDSTKVQLQTWNKKGKGFAIIK